MDDTIATLRQAADSSKDDDFSKVNSEMWLESEEA
jgi:hypothetical protein